MGAVGLHEGLNGVTEERSTLGGQLDGPVLWDEALSLVKG